MKNQSAFFDKGYIDTNFRFFDNDKSKTFMTWIKFANCKDETVSIILGQRDGYNGRVEFYAVDNKIIIYSPSCDLGTVDLEIQKDKWYHVALVLDNNLKVIKIYLNGNFQVESKIKGSFIDSNVSIGKYPNTSYVFNGNMTEIRFYNYAMTEEEILYKMNKKENKNNSSLLGYYSFENDLLDVTQRINNIVANNIKLSLDYPQEIKMFKYLLKKNNQYYTTKFKDIQSNQFLPLNFIEPSQEDYTLYGIKDLNELTIKKNEKIIKYTSKYNLGKGQLFELKLNNEIRRIKEIDTNVVYDLYNSQFSKGGRQKVIKVTCSEGLPKGGSVTNLIDGENDDSFYFYENLSDQWILFEFQESVCIQQFKWIQSKDIQHGKWQLQGSNDNIKFVSLGEDFTLTNGTFDIENYNKYRYYKLQQIEGVTSNTPWLYEVEFGINANVLKYLIQYNNQLYTLNGEKMILSPSQELTEDNFNVNGFNDLITKSDIILSKIDNQSDIKIWVYTEDLNVKEIELECQINPYRPIDILKKQFENKFQILIMEEK